VIRPEARTARGAVPLSASERYEIARRVFDRAGGGRPWIVLLDGVQWGADALAFADDLMRRRDRSPARVLLLLTVRDESVEPGSAEAGLLEDLRGQRGVDELAVPVLNPADHRQLVRGLLCLDGDLARSVEARTAGNPLFAEQLVGDWVARGVLVAGTTGFALREGESGALPEDIHEVWTARIDVALRDFDPKAYEALERAAALGVEVTAREWAPACVDLPEGLAAELSEELLARRLTARSHDWRFVHPMLRESIRRRAEEAGRWSGANRHCAEALEHLSEAGHEGLTERIGRLWVEAGEPERALAPLLTAAEERLESSDYGAGEALLALRARQVERLGLDPGDERRGWGALGALRMLAASGPSRVGTETVAEALIAEARRHGWVGVRATATRLAGAAATQKGLSDEGRRRLEEARDLAREAGLPEEEARCHLGLAFSARVRGDLDAASTLGHLALAQFERSRLLPRQVECHLLFGQIHQAAGQLDQAEEALRTGLALLERSGSRFGLAASQNSLGEVHRARGDVPAALGCYRASARTFRELESASEAFPLINLGLVAAAESRHPSATRALERAVALSAATGRGGVADHARGLLLPLRARAGQWERWAHELSAVVARFAPGPISDPDLARALADAADLARGSDRAPDERSLRSLIEGPSGS